MRLIETLRDHLEARRLGLAKRLVGLDADAIAAVLAEADEDDHAAIVAELKHVLRNGDQK
jgi:hypothetical protein